MASSPRAHTRRKTGNRPAFPAQPVSPYGKLLSKAGCTWCETEIAAALLHMPPAPKLIRTAPYRIAEVEHPLSPHQVVRQVDEGDRQFAPPQHFFLLLRALLTEKGGDHILFWRSALNGGLWEVNVTNRVVTVGPVRTHRVWPGARTLFMPLAA